MRFERVAIAADAMLPGDGYEQYIKPFRTVEDIHVTAALLSFGALSGMDPAKPLTQLALTGALVGSAALFAEATAWWQAMPDDPASQRWLRDARIFGTASGVRQQRAVRAWERLAGG